MGPMMSPEEKWEIKQLVHQELAAIEYEIAHNAGSYRYLCALGGVTFFSHTPVGTVVRSIPPRTHFPVSV
ncbi:hypothetical protein SEA_YASSIFIED_75 [Mycobacterium phage Yassified]|uniref:Uncharacterized protein n=3 Tax=Bixzunavirus Bxz1 TaxID=2006134 RepID=B5LKI8_9CAUD|nr:gp78 [Mycobacterium phage Spud]YP_656090.1 gp77 [Mycobacterium phage Catera]ABE67830.1 hypothetical protein PBI_CATERA_77 [Mycobacterium phage Catera]ACH62535.1 hypothetical protein SPUD_78 [Mycobacterium phage Spud]WNT44678.1 hypothetical protein SEA_YASSIFIED_75 [Mycobacterium phage Yassified]